MPGALTLDHAGLTIDAALDGLGVAYVPEPADKPYLRTGELISSRTGAHLVPVSAFTTRAIATCLPACVRSSIS